MSAPSTVYAIIQAGFESDKIVGIYSSEELARKAKGAFALVIASGPFCKDLVRITESFRIEQFSLDEVSDRWTESCKAANEQIKELMQK